MIDALVSGRLFRQPELKTGKSGAYYCNFLMTVSTGEPEKIAQSIAPAIERQAMVFNAASGMRQ